jgi:hypothetical protein
MDGQMHDTARGGEEIKGERSDSDVHDVERVPEDGVGVEVGSGVEPEHELLLALALAVAEDVGVQEVGLAAHVAQELEVHLVVPRATRADLHRPCSSLSNKIKWSANKKIIHHRLSNSAAQNSKFSILYEE